MSRAFHKNNHVMESMRDGLWLHLLQRNEGEYRGFHCWISGSLWTLSVFTTSHRSWTVHWPLPLRSSSRFFQTLSLKLLSLSLSLSNSAVFWDSNWKRDFYFVMNERLHHTCSSVMMFPQPAPWLVECVTFKNKMFEKLSLKKIDLSFTDENWSLMWKWSFMRQSFENISLNRIQLMWCGPWDCWNGKVFRNFGLIINSPKDPTYKLLLDHCNVCSLHWTALLSLVSRWCRTLGSWEYHPDCGISSLATLKFGRCSKSDLREYITYSYKVTWEY